MEKRNDPYDRIILLQPTSPLRTAEHVRQALAKYDQGYDIVYSVMESEANPYINLYEEDESGTLVRSKPHSSVRRQDAPKVYQVNGAVYVINARRLRSTPINQLKRKGFIVMDKRSSVDIDTPLDWQWVEFLLNQPE